MKMVLLNAAYAAHGGPDSLAMAWYTDNEELIDTWGEQLTKAEIDAYVWPRTRASNPILITILFLLAVNWRSRKKGLLSCSMKPLRRG